MRQVKRIATDPRRSRAVVYNGIVFIGGQTADDRTQDIRGQTTQTLAKIDKFLAAAGIDKSRLLTAQIWIKDIAADFAGMNEVWDASVRQTVGLALMAIYRRPRNALTVAVLSLIVPLEILLNSWPPSMPRLMLAVAAVLAVNGLCVAAITAGTRRVLMKLWQGKREMVVTISSRGLEMSRGVQSIAILPWTSVDRVIEMRSWIVLVLGRRPVIALPLAWVPQQRLGRLREILRTAKAS